MAAGLGFKTFTTGEVLTAADTNGYLMQGVLVFASAAARDAAITSPQEGQFAYLKDTNVTTYYTGSAWANLDTTGMTNPMTTTGDMVYSSSGSTPARLGIGTTGQVVTVAGGIPSWATPSTGAVTLISQQTVTGSSVANISFTSISGSYKNLRIVYNALITSGSWDHMQMRFNNDTGGNYISQLCSAIATSVTGSELIAGTFMRMPRVAQTGASTGFIVIPNYSAAILKKSAVAQGISLPAYTAGAAQLFSSGNGWDNTAAITQIDLFVGSSIQWQVGSSFTLYGES